MSGVHTTLEMLGLAKRCRCSLCEHLIECMVCRDDGGVTEATLAHFQEIRLKERPHMARPVREAEDRLIRRRIARPRWGIVR